MKVLQTIEGLSMFKNVFSFILILLLIGCGTKAKKITLEDGKLRYVCCANQMVAGDNTYVSIAYVWSEEEALPLAEKYCSKYGKRTKFNRMVVLERQRYFMVEDYRAKFDCVD